MTALKTVGLIFVMLVLMHWLSAGKSEIVEGPPEPLDSSLVQQP